MTAPAESPRLVVRTSCPDCGEVRLDSRAVRTRARRGSASGTIAFECPHCRARVVRDVAPFQLTLLRRLDVPVEVWEWPAELAESHDGPPITPDDILDAHLLLADERWREDLRNACERAHS